MIQIARLISKELNNLVLKYTRANHFLPGFFRPKIFLDGKNDSLPVILRTDPYIFIKFARRILSIYL